MCFGGKTRSRSRQTRESIHMQVQLTEEQIQFGFYYYFPNRKNTIPRVTEVSEYAGEEGLIINCTQLGTDYKSAKERKRVLNLLNQLEYFRNWSASILRTSKKSKIMPI